MKCRIDIEKFQNIYSRSIIRYNKIIASDPSKYDIKDEVFQKDLLGQLLEQELLASPSHQEISDADIKQNRDMSESLEDSRLSKGDAKDKVAFRKELISMEEKILICVLDIKNQRDNSFNLKADLILNKINLPRLIRHIGVVLDDARYVVENDLELKRRLKEFESNKSENLVLHKSMDEILEEIKSKPAQKSTPSCPYEDYPLVSP